MSVTITSFGFTIPGGPTPAPSYSYNAGQTIQAVLNYTSTDFTQGASTTADDVVTASASNSSGAGSPTTPFTITITSPGPLSADPTTVAVSDTGGRTWTTQSNTMLSFNSTTGVSTWQAIFTATA